MRAWESKLIRLINENQEAEDYLKCIEILCSEYKVTYRNVKAFMLGMQEAAKKLADNE